MSNIQDTIITALLNGPKDWFWTTDKTIRPLDYFLSELRNASDEVRLQVAEKFPQVRTLMGDIPIKSTDETPLEYTQNVRLAVLAKLTENGLPTDAKDVYALQAILDSMDKQELAKRKLDEEAKKNASDQEAQDLIASLMGKLGNANPFLANAPVDRDVTNDQPLVDDISLVENELDFMPKATNYETFTKEYRKNNPKD